MIYLFLLFSKEVSRQNKEKNGLIRSYQYFHSWFCFQCGFCFVNSLLGVIYCLVSWKKGWKSGFISIFFCYSVHNLGMKSFIRSNILKYCQFSYWRMFLLMIPTKKVTISFLMGLRRKRVGRRYYWFMEAFWQKLGILSRFQLLKALTFISLY